MSIFLCQQNVASPFFREEFDMKGWGGGDGVRHHGSPTGKAEPEVEEDRRETRAKKTKKTPPPGL